jgi:hypothetical protein
MVGCVGRSEGGECKGSELEERPAKRDGGRSQQAVYG